MPLFNPLSIAKALEKNKVEDYWVETGTVISSILAQAHMQMQDDMHRWRNTFGEPAKSSVMILVVL